MWSQTDCGACTRIIRGGEVYYGSRVSSSSDTLEVNVDVLWLERKVEMSAKCTNLKS
jgi:hypothetical protein